MEKNEEWVTHKRLLNNRGVFLFKFIEEYQVLLQARYKSTLFKHFLSFIV